MRYLSTLWSRLDKTKFESSKDMPWHGCDKQKRPGDTAGQSGRAVHAFCTAANCVCIAGAPVQALAADETAASLGLSRKLQHAVPLSGSPEA